MKSLRSDDEAARLEDLHATLLATAPEDRFDRLTRLAQRALGAPIALFSLVDADRLQIKSAQGLGTGDAPRNGSFCGQTILSNEVFVVPDAAADPRFTKNPLVVGPPHARFYAGCPIRTRRGHRIGTLCVLDSEQRSWTEDDEKLLVDLARLVEDEVEHDRVRLLGLNPDNFVRAFPFGFALDQSLHVVLAGRALPKLCRRDPLSTQFQELFTLLSPAAEATFEGLAAHTDELIVLEVCDKGAVLRGSFTLTEDRATLLFVGSAWITTLGDLERLGIERSDFALHDPATELISLLEHNARAIAELRHLNEDLTAAKTRAEQATRATSSFLAHMSHEIRTPLNAVLGMSSLLLDANLPADLHDYVDTIRSSGENLLAVVTDILDFSKIESGKLPIESLPMSPLRLVDDCLDLVALNASRVGLDLAGWCTQAVPDRVRGDPARVRQVLLNLVSNAVKFTEQGHVLVVADYDTRLGELEIVVEDTGDGIDPALVETLFDPFMQGSRATSRRFGGTGLGLTISRRLARMMGGEVRLERSSTGGTRAVFRFPAPMTSSHSTAVMPLAAVGLSIVVFESSALHQRSLLQRLRRLGSNPIAATSLSEAIEIMVRGDARVLVLGSRLVGPELDDWVACVREAGSFPLVVCAPAGTHDQPDKRLRFVQRPAKLTRLARALHDVLEAPPSHEPPAAITVPSIRVLLVEDDPINQKVASLMIARVGLTCDIAENGFVALEKTAASTYDLVLMDVQMPELDGLEATRRIRARGGLQPRIVALTAATTADERALCFQAGFDAFLTKPIDPDQLTTVLRNT
ncbi:MAG: ATP-binding protein [Polyangiaceae bacterium]